MACQNHALEVPDFVSKGETTFLPLCADKLHGRNFSRFP